jgi:hypothetical protein
MNHEEAQATAPVGQRPQQSPVEEPIAWEMIENGRYMPRRIRGSFPGRELG